MGTDVSTRSTGNLTKKMALESYISPMEILTKAIS
jgi:hypothetical protein